MGHHKPIIGVTGSIGAGKTTVSRLLASLGAFVIDSDALAHEVLRRSDVVAELVGWWGESILQRDGSINRRAVAIHVFDHPAALKRLEGLLYPAIHKRRSELVQEAAGRSEYNAIVLDVPKLFEAGVQAECDVVIVVDADPGIRASRVAERGWSGQELERREKQLSPLDKKRELADYVITNDDGLASLRQRVEEVFNSLLADFSQRHT